MSNFMRHTFTLIFIIFLVKSEITPVEIAICPVKQGGSPTYEVNLFIYEKLD